MFILFSIGCCFHSQIQEHDWQTPRSSWWSCMRPDPCLCAVSCARRILYQDMTFRAWTQVHPQTPGIGACSIKALPSLLPLLNLAGIFTSKPPSPTPGAKTPYKVDVECSATGKEAHVTWQHTGLVQDRKVSC